MPVKRPFVKKCAYLALCHLSATQIACLRDIARRQKDCDACDVVDQTDGLILLNLGPVQIGKSTPDDYPEWADAMPAMRQWCDWAAENGYQMLHFDLDGDQVEGLQVYA